ncbi:MAG: hypothetical protein WC707_06445 [Candidatus Babeliaceae bacterium]|jgi:hypothetical protein
MKLQQKVITFFSIMLFCFFTALPYPYRFQRLLLLDKDTQDIKNCVDIIYDHHIAVDDFAKKPSISKVKEGLLQLDEQHALSTPDRTLLAAFRTLNKRKFESGNAKKKGGVEGKIDLLWESTEPQSVNPNAEKFIKYAAGLFSKEFTGANNITFIDSDTYRQNSFIFLAFEAMRKELVPMHSTAELSWIPIGVTEYFKTTSCDITTSRQYCDLMNIKDTESREKVAKKWSALQDEYKTKILPFFTKLLQSNDNAQ